MTAFEAWKTGRDRAEQEKRAGIFDSIKLWRSMKATELLPELDVALSSMRGQLRNTAQRFLRETSPEMRLQLQGQTDAIKTQIANIVRKREDLIAQATSRLNTAYANPQTTTERVLSAINPKWGQRAHLNDYSQTLLSRQYPHIPESPGFGGQVAEMFGVGPQYQQFKAVSGMLPPGVAPLLGGAALAGGALALPKILQRVRGAGGMMNQAGGFVQKYGLPIGIGAGVGGLGTMALSRRNEA